MLPGPVFQVEMLTTARRPRYYAIRVLYGMALLVLMWQNYAAWDRFNNERFAPQQMKDFARSTFVSMMVLQGVGVLAITPALCAGVIANEKQRKTLHYLLASRLTSPEIVLGKLMARMLHIVVLLAAGLPVMTMLGLFGGVDPMEALLGTAGCVSTAFFLASLAVLCSTISRRVREAITAVYALEAAWLFLPWLVRSAVPMYYPELYATVIRPVNDWLFASTPWSPLQSGLFMRFSGAGMNPVYEAALWMIAVQIGAGLALAMLAVWRLRPVFKAQEGARAFRFLGIPLPGRKTGRIRLFGRRPLGERAMIWKELHTSRTSGAAQFVGLAIGLLIAGTVAYWTFYFAGDAWREFVSGPYDTRGLGDVPGYYGNGPFRLRYEFNTYLRWVTTAVSVITIMSIAVSGANTFTSEREDDTWISLTATPMDGPEIVGAKMLGVLWKARWPLIGIAFLWVIGLLTGAVHPMGIVFQAVTLAILLSFAATLGTRLSLHAKSSWRSQSSAVAILVFVGGGYLACCCPMMFQGRPTMLYFAGFIPMILAFTLVTPWEFSDIFLVGRHRNFGPGDQLGELIAAMVMGLLAYGVAAAFLGVASVSGFDRAADRPARDNFGMPPMRLTPPAKPKGGDEPNLT